MNNSDIHAKNLQGYKNMFAADPAVYVAGNIRAGDYKYWGFRERKGSPPMEWIPGITGQKSNLDRFDFVSIGLEINDSTNGEAELFFRKYNLLVEQERRLAIIAGKKFDTYWNEL